tara:strand:- start:1312 stop:1626 length:315 start_codon:yes stop_codon:yes gene_type:complete
MINKKIILGLFIYGLLGACSSPTAMLGPVYTLSSTGNVFQAGFSYGSGELVKMHTGKTTIENIKKAVTVQDKNIEKRTLQSEEFYFMVKKKIDKANGIINLSSQ